jgi:hypothetical protein
MQCQASQVQDFSVPFSSEHENKAISCKCLQKRTGRDEPIWVVIHIYMETTQGISLYSYLYLKLAKALCFSN